MVFFGDVAIRRVAVDDWARTALTWLTTLLRGNQEHEESDDRMARLRNKKAEVAGDIDQRRAATRFDPQTDAPPDRSLEDIMSSASSGPPREAPRPSSGKPGMTPAEAEEESYTARLLKAKKGAFKEKGDDGKGKSS